MKNGAAFKEDSSTEDVKNEGDYGQGDGSQPLQNAPFIIDKNRSRTRGVVNTASMVTPRKLF